MSIILKGIDLPKADEIHRLIVLPTGQVIEDKKTYYNEYEAIQIPKGHGRIIDIGAYKKEGAMQDYTCEGCPNEGKCIYYEYTKRDICDWLDDAPTILEAEDECEICKHQGDEYWCRDAYTNSDGNCSIYEPTGEEEE